MADLPFSVLEWASDLCSILLSFGSIDGILKCGVETTVEGSTGDEMSTNDSLRKIMYKQYEASTARICAEAQVAMFDSRMKTHALWPMGG